ncbi:GNAT family N-acetyltransferase [Paenibacillus sp. GCM10027626]|uniref:GNAT family N-acetyltransferase n=1 Tax=Paenibacillus sp. GCM10027626 TaxID=3273411 RepID=UPI003633FAFA
MTIEIRRLGHDAVEAVCSFIEDVASRLPDRVLYAGDDANYLHALISHRGEMYGAFMNERLVAYSAIIFPGIGENNLGASFGVPQHELLRVASLDGTVVHESARGNGLQRKFHEHREQVARQYGCLHLYSTVHPENKASLRNLEACGFTYQFSRTMYGGLPRDCYAKKLQ